VQLPLIGNLREEVTPVNQSVDQHIELYLPNAFATSLEPEEALTDGTAKHIVALLVDNGVFPSDVDVIDFTTDDSRSGHLDMNAAFLRAINTPKLSEAMRMGSLVNTVLTFFSLKEVWITVQGAAPVTTDTYYDFPLQFYPDPVGFEYSDADVVEGISALPDWFGAANIWRSIQGDWTDSAGNVLSIDAQERTHGLAYGTVGPSGCFYDSADRSTFGTLVASRAKGEKIAELVFEFEDSTMTLLIDFSGWLENWTLRVKTGKTDWVAYTGHNPMCG